MADYSRRRTFNEQDVINLNADEYALFNKIYKQAIKEKVTQLRGGKSGESSETKGSFMDEINLKYVILTDGTYRVEFVVEQK